MMPKGKQSSLAESQGSSSQIHVHIIIIITLILSVYFPGKVQAHNRQSCASTVQKKSMQPGSHYANTCALYFRQSYLPTPTMCVFREYSLTAMENTDANLMQICCSQSMASGEFSTDHAVE